MAAPFPQEIFDLVIDFLDVQSPSIELDTRTLKACTLVSSAFCHRAQRQLFHNLHIHLSPQDSNKFIHLQEFLASVPHLRTHVRSLHVHLLTTFIPTSEAALPGSINLPRLSSLYIKTDTLEVTNSGRLSFRVLPDCLKQYFYTLAQLPTLRSLAITDLLEVPVSFLRTPAQLMSLTVQDSRIVPDSLSSDSGCVRDEESRSLETLKVACFFSYQILLDVLLDARSSLTCMYLRSLDLFIYYPEHFMQCRTILKTVAPYLQSLKLLIWLARQNPLDLTLRDLPCLRHLCLEAETWYVLPDVFRLLDTIPSINTCLEDVELAMSNEVRDVYELDRLWRPLDEILLGAGLQRLVVNIKGSHLETSEWNRGLVEDILREEVLQRWQKMGCLVVETT